MRYDGITPAYLASQKRIALARVADLLIGGIK